MIDLIRAFDFDKIEQEYPEFEKKQPVICRTVMREYYAFLAATYSQEDIFNFFRSYTTNESVDPVAINLGPNVFGFADAYLLSQIKQDKSIELPQEAEKLFLIMQMAIYSNKKEMFKQAFAKNSTITDDQHLALKTLAGFMNLCSTDFLPEPKVPSSSKTTTPAKTEQTGFFSWFFRKPTFPGDHYESQLPSSGSINGDGGEKSSLLGKKK